MIRQELLPLLPYLTGINHNPQLQCRNTNLLEYVDVFLNDLIRLYQGPAHWQSDMKRNLFYVLDKIFSPLDDADSIQQN